MSDIPHRPPSQPAFLPVPRTAVLDTCVLLQSYLLDVLLTAAERGLCHVRWSAESLAELEEHYVLIRTRKSKDTISEDVAREQIRRKIEAMTAAFPEALITELGDLDSLDLRDLDDRHVLAAAIQCGADCIVTHNLRDFTMSTLVEHGIGLESPDQFLQSIAGMSPSALVKMTRVLRYVSQKTRRPHVPLGKLLDSLEKSAPIFSEQMRIALQPHIDPPDSSG
jgi:predicted nucleic acid-binding protein